MSGKARICVTKLQPRVPSAGRPWTSGCRLVCVPMHPEELHAFAMVKLRLRPEWATRRGNELYYEISPGQRVVAVRSGAVDLEDGEIAGAIGAGDVWLASLFGAEGRPPNE